MSEDLGPTNGPLSGKGRFELRRRLGSGGMGVVFEALDRQRNSLVALKTLRDVDAQALIRFKNEFRALADISHPNLATLYELINDEGSWCFTMELIEGLDFLSYVRRDGAPPPATGTALPTATSTLDTMQLVVGPGPPVPMLTHAPPVDEDRLRSALRQLVRAVAALHAAGRLHRDIKPSNILVESDGRLALCDFGLVALMREHEPFVDGDSRVVGTVTYMSPEQAARAPLTEASDWYSVGVLLYAALTGQVPFAHRRHEILRLKQIAEPQPAIDRNPDAPEDLCDLCDRLIRIDPRERPNVDEIFAALGMGPDALAHTDESARTGAPFVGRRTDLALLDGALADVRLGLPRVVFVHGSSGMGKTTLVQRFLENLELGDEVLVLSARCYEREAVGYKAIDPLIDELARYLGRLDADTVRELVPPDIASLARLFPVLDAIDVVAGAPLPPPDRRAPHELRRQAFGAFRELCARLSARRPLVLFIDDLQWGDVDSATLLSQLWRGPGAPPVLVVATYRTEDAATSPMLREILAHDFAAADVRVTAISVAPLSSDECAGLAASLIPGVSDDVARSVAREAAGNPFLVLELVRHLTREQVIGRTPSTDLGATVDDMLRVRIATLGDSERSLLRVLSVAGRPIGVRVAERASGIGEDFAHVLAVLGMQHLMRTSVARDRQWLEPYHDRIRETVARSIPSLELAELHLRLARALETVGHADPEQLVEHWRAAGEWERAARDAIRAAGQAALSLAFDRAASFYRIALELGEYPDKDARDLRERLGDALSQIGRGKEAAEAFLEAAAGASPASRMELERRAAFELLRSGYVDEGVETLERVLQRVGMRLAPTPRRALLSLVALRARLRLRGLRFALRDESEVPPEVLSRIDTCWSAATGLAMVDTLRGAEFQSRHLALSLDAGERRRIVQALSIETAYLSLGGRRARARVERVSALAERAAEGMDDPMGRAWVIGSRALADYQIGAFASARAGCEEVFGLLRGRVTGIEWEVASTDLYRLWALFYLGDVREMILGFHQVLQDAEERGDRYALASLRAGVPAIALLLQGRPELVGPGVEQALDGWSQRGFHLQHWGAVQVLANRDLYNGDAEAACARMREGYEQLRRSLLSRIELVRVEALHLYGRCELGVAAAGAGEPDALFRRVLRRARAIERCELPYAVALAACLRAGVAAIRGDLAEAIGRFDAAASRFDAAHMELYAAAARWRRAELVGGSSGRERRSQLASWMTQRAIAEPARVVDMLVPM